MAVAGKGWHSLAISIDDRLIAKFPEGEEAEAALRREARLLVPMRSHVTLPIPDMTLHEGPVLFSLHRKIPGERVNPGDYMRLSSAARHRFACDLARFFAQLHDIPIATMRMAGADAVDWWDTRPETLAPVWAVLPDDVAATARRAIEDYSRLSVDRRNDVFGFFDAHGWNMAFDHERDRLNGIFDFADCGFGPPEREFVQVSLIHPELAGAVIDAYQDIARRRIDRRVIFLLGAAMRLSELAGALETGDNLEFVRSFAADWFRQTVLR